MMKRLKTLIVVDNLHTGGVATSLYNYLHFVHDKMDCSLLVFNEETIDANKIPSDVRILNSSKALHILGKNHEEIKQESIALMLFRLAMIFVARYVNGVAARKLLWPFVRKAGEYDLALAYAQDDSWRSISKGCIDYVLYKVRAKHRSVMVHCDYRNFGGYSPKQKKTFAQLDSIVCVSKSCVESFVKCFPSVSGKTVACENFTKVEEIRSLAGEGYPYDDGIINFVSACRLSTVKGLDRTIEAFAHMTEEGLRNFTWTIVGEGPEERRLKDMVSAYGLDDCILFAGNQANPYPYIKNASCFLLPSVHEAAPMVFGESAALGVPVLSTATCSARELVEKRHLGWVVENSSAGIEAALHDLLSKNKILSVAELSEDQINSNAQRQFDNYIKSVVC